MLRGEPITIHGDGRQTCDFVYVDDVVDAWMRVVDDAATFGRVLNVGSGRETSVNELADAVLGAFGQSRATWEIRVEPAQLGDQRRAAADTAELQALGWAARATLSEGMTRAVEWARTLSPMS